MDGTLIDSMHFWRRLKYDLLEYYYNRTRERIVLTESQKAEIEKLSTKRAIRFINSAHNSSVSYKKDCYPLIEEFYLNECKIKAGVKEGLEYFSTLGIKMAVCTETPEKLAKIALREQGIAHYFKFIMTPEKAKSSKARPTVFKMCASKLLKRKKNIVLVDDAPYALKTAKGLGMCTVGVVDGMQIDVDDCDFLFKDFSEMLEYFIKEGGF